MHLFLSIRNWIDSKRVLHTSMMVFLLGVYFFPTENSLKNFFYLTVLLPFLLSVDIAKLKKLLGSKLFLAILLFVFYSYLSISWNPATRQSEYFSYFARMVNLLVFIAALFGLVRREPDYLYTLFNWMVYIAGLMAIVSIVVFYADHSFPTFRLENWGALYHANTGASCYGIAAVVCYCHYILDKNRGHRWHYYLILAVLMIDIALTLSRGVWLALIAAFAVTQLMRKRFILILALLIAVVMYVLLIKFGVLESSWYFMRNGGDNFRFAAWSKVMEHILDSPWFGFGVNTDESLQITDSFTMYHAHSVYFSQLIYGGIIGVVLLTVVAMLSLAGAVKLSAARRDTTYTALVIFALAGVATDHSQLLLNPSQVWYFFWFPIAIIVAMSLDTTQIDARTSTSTTENIVSVDDASHCR